MNTFATATDMFDRLRTLRATLEEADAETCAIEAVLDASEDDYLRRLAAETVAAGWFDVLPLFPITEHLPAEARRAHTYRMLSYAPNARQGDHQSPVRLFLLRDDGRLFSLDTWGYPCNHWHEGHWYSPRDRFWYAAPRRRLFRRPKPVLRPFEAGHLESVTGWPFRITITRLIDNLERALQYQQTSLRDEIQTRIIEAERRHERVQAAS